ncbi:MAG: hypothetical protein LBL79_07760 [Prevotella sp.]|jgi:hypothetical protein|nr:hypothetical protein [Prevotella sp.]
MVNKMAGPKNLTPKQLMDQWRALPNKFDVNIWNFEVKAGKAAVSVFQESFYLRRFNSSGEFGWKERRKPRPYPILEETGSLKNSIKWKHLGTKCSKSAAGARIYTDPNGFQNTKRHRGFCYAAVHNAPDGTYTYGRTGVRSIQRQYIGHSTVLKNKLKELSPIIFDGFPK